MTSADAAAACLVFRADIETEYTSVAINNSILHRAADLAEKHALRGYDAIQLSAAIETNLDTVGSGLPPLTLLSSDREMNAAAVLEGVTVDNPANHK
jgi:predicted nucleic acid-binding protein